MPVLQYNPIQDAFTTYETVETPKVTLNFPLSDSPVDISDWSIGIGSSGIPIAKPAIERPHMVTSDVIAPFHNTPTDSAQASASDSVKGSSVPNERAQQAYQFFLNNGFSNYAAAGIVGNLYHESGGLNTKILGDGKKSIGLAQWNGNRRKNLEAFAKKKGKSIDDFQTQLEFVLHELNSDDTFMKKALKGLHSAKSVKDATMSFMKYYERPGLPHFESRLKHAQSVFK